jgi:hypothetical protein
MNFKENKYTVVKNAISEELAKFCYDYFLLKLKVAETLFRTKYISPYTTLFGTWDDGMLKETYSHYSDIVMETLLVKLLSIVEKNTGLKLNENYSYARVYKKGDKLHRHKDRFSCEISTTLNLGGNGCWPILLEPDSSVGVLGPDKYIPSNSKGIKIFLEPGDMLIYKGNELEHWREELKFENCVQVFLHYNNIETQGSKENIYDKRLHLGLPADIKNENTK